MAHKLISAVIVDNDAETRGVLVQIISGFDELKIVGSASNAIEGLQIIIKHKPDIAFLDIDMPGQSGIELAELLMQNRSFTRVVFVTAFDKFILQAIRVSALDYILKPVDPDEIKNLLFRYKNHPERSVAEVLNQFISKVKIFGKIRLNIRTGYILVDPSDIIMIKADGNYSEIHLLNADKVLVSQPICHFCEKLTITEQTAPVNSEQTAPVISLQMAPLKIYF